MRAGALPTTSLSLCWTAGIGHALFSTRGGGEMLVSSETIALRRQSRAQHAVNLGGDPRALADFRRLRQERSVRGDYDAIEPNDALVDGILAGVFGRENIRAVTAETAVLQRPQHGRRLNQRPARSIDQQGTRLDVENCLLIDTDGSQK